jgi:hypothetical protein
MTRKIITGVIAAVLVVTIAVLAAEKAKEKAFAGKPCPQAKAGEQGEGFEQHKGLLDQLAEAYKANDREKMGEIIAKMQERREKMEKFVKADRWHRWEHRRMMGPGNGAMQGRQMGPGWGQGQQMAGPGSNQNCSMNGPRENRGWAMQGQGQNQGCPMAMAGSQCGQFQAMRGRGFGGCNNMMGNYGAVAGPQGEQSGWGCGPGFFNGMGNCGAMPGQNFGQMPCQQGGMGMGMDNQMPQQGGPMQMRGWGRGDLQQNFEQGQGDENMGTQQWNMPRRQRQIVPPAEWGW